MLKLAKYKKDMVAEKAALDPIKILNLPLKPSNKQKVKNADQKKNWK